MNCLLTSLTTSCAVRPTAEQAQALKTNISMEPNKPPIKTSGTAISTCNSIVGSTFEETVKSKKTQYPS